MISATYQFPKTVVSLLAAILMLFAGFSRAAQAGPVAPHVEINPQPAQIGQNGGAKISPDVQAAMKSLQPGDMLTVIVTLNDQVNLSQLAATPPGRNRAARLKNVVTQLQSKAQVSQRAIKVLLNLRRAEARVSQVEYLWIFNGLAVTATPDVIQEIAARPEVARISANDSIQAPPPLTPQELGAQAAAAQANLQLVNAPALWDLGLTGQGVVVANLDTGVDIAYHQDLVSKWRGGSNSWFDPYGENATPDDLNGHGTWTMGVMVGGQQYGTAYGVAPGAKWIAAKIFNNAGQAYVLPIHQAFQWLLDPDGDPNTDDAPHVVNSSWTWSPGCNTEFQTAVQNLRAAGILPIFAAGNNSSVNFSPANYAEAFAVGAVDNNDVIYGSSSRGPSACDPTATFPDIVAPGMNIYTTDIFGLHTYATGTSLAAPHVSGALALLLSAAPQLTPDEQEAALLAGAVDLGATGPDNTFGNGRLDVLASLQSLGDVAVTQTATPNPALVDNSLSYTITVTNNSPVTATVVTLNNSLPAGLSPGSITPSQGSCGLPVTGVFTCTIGTLPGKFSATVTLSITPTARGTITNTAVVSATETDFDTSNNVNAANTSVLTEMTSTLFLPFIMK